MPYSEAQKKATRKYIAKTYDRLELQLKKGMKDVYRAQAAVHGMSLNAYIIGLLEADRTPPAGPVEASGMPQTADAPAVSPVPAPCADPLRSRPGGPPEATSRK